MKISIKDAEECVFYFFYMLDVIYGTSIWNLQNDMAQQDAKAIERLYDKYANKFFKKIEKVTIVSLANMLEDTYGNNESK